MKLIWDLRLLTYDHLDVRVARLEHELPILKTPSELLMESISSFTERVELLYKQFYTIWKPQFKMPNEGLLAAENAKPSEFCTTWQSKHAAFGHHQ